MNEKKLKDKLLDVIVNSNSNFKTRLSEREEFFYELSDEWLSTGNNLNYYYDKLGVSEISGDDLMLLLFVICSIKIKQHFSFYQLTIIIA